MCPTATVVVGRGVRNCWLECCTAGFVWLTLGEGSHVTTWILSLPTDDHRWCGHLLLDDCLTNTSRYIFIVSALSLDVDCSTSFLMRSNCTTQLTSNADTGYEKNTHYLFLTFILFIFMPVYLLLTQLLFFNPQDLRMVRRTDWLIVSLVHLLAFMRSCIVWLLDYAR